MKIKNIRILPALFIAVLSSLTSCGVDRWPEYAAWVEQDEWITNVMRENYLWYQDIPSNDDLNLFTSPSVFLKTVVSKNEDKDFSFVDTVRATPPLSYGFDYTLYRVINNDTAYNALITYILPKSPASEAGLKRGDYIMKVNNEFITKKSETRLLSNSGAVKLQIGKYIGSLSEEEEGGDEAPTTEDVIKTRIADMGAKQAVENDPINFDTILSTPKGKVGYLVYSRFKAGPTLDSQKYNDNLRTIFRQFAGAGVSYFILDLRYNTGGSLECAQLLSTMLAPSNVLGTRFASLEYNDKQTKKNRTLTYDAELIGTGGSLNIKGGIIISSSTTKGIVGTMLNCLSPLKMWSLIGSSVACQGVATESFTSPKYPWIINPVVCLVKNSENRSGRGGSFTPVVTINEITERRWFLPFGNPNESLLYEALDLINPIDPPTETRRSNASKLR